MISLYTFIKMRSPGATREELFKLGVWTTADGRRTHVSNLHNKHLINIASFLLKSAIVEADKLARFSLSMPGPQEEMAQFVLYDFWHGEGPVYRILESHPFHPHIKAELKKRGLLEEKGR